LGTQPTTDIDLLNKTLQAIIPNAKGKRQLPPVDSWNPPYSADIGLEIHKDGTWWHQGTRFTRQKLVDLFATILRKDEDGSTYLVTPYEKVIVHVEDAPFLGVRIDSAHKDDLPVLVVTTNLGDTVEIGPKHPLRVEIDPATKEPSPYVRIRGRLEAKITRPAFYELVDLAEDIDGVLRVQSHGQSYDLGPVA
jgi:uncharacterized protein